VNAHTCFALLCLVVALRTGYYSIVILKAYRATKGITSSSSGKQAASKRACINLPYFVLHFTRNSRGGIMI